MAVSPDQVAVAAGSLLIGSELLSLTPRIRANGWVQLILAALRGIAATQTPPRR